MLPQQALLQEIPVLYVLGSSGQHKNRKKKKWGSKYEEVGLLDDVVENIKCIET